MKSEIEKIKQEPAADWKWIWLRKDLICILCWTLMGLCLLKYEHQAGNIWMARNDGEIYVKRSRGIFSFQRARQITCQGVRENKEAINESYPMEVCLFFFFFSPADRKPILLRAASLNNRAAAVRNARTCTRWRIKKDDFCRGGAQQDHFRARTAPPHPNQLRLKYEAWMSRHDRGNEAATAATLFVSPAHALPCTVFVHVRPLGGDTVALVKKTAGSHMAPCGIFLLTVHFFWHDFKCVWVGKSLSRRTSSE